MGGLLTLFVLFGAGVTLATQSDDENDDYEYEENDSHEKRN
jgi:hypothetical protein